MFTFFVSTMQNTKKCDFCNGEGYTRAGCCPMCGGSGKMFNK
ncbi:hypothetical protein [Salmonella phage NJ12]|uniref:Uncharacterized protein n=1 Tax=Salmonella phage NJ12 TaxID=3043562 RepID=A0A9Y1ZCL9_9CAUD|nr:hypothetical protein [Salmonella phage NJ12]